MPDTQRFSDALRQLDQTLAALDAPAPPAASLPEAPRGAPATPDPVRTLARLLVGTALLGMDELSRRAPEWERRAAAVAPQPPASPLTAPGDGAEDALIGWLFVTMERMRPAWNPIRWAESAGGHLVDTAAAVARTAILRPLDGSAPRQADLERWAALGRAEGSYSRALAQVAFRNVTEDIIDAVADSPAVRRLVQEIVQDQSATLANDVMGEVRERAITGDTAVEGFVRRLLRLPAPAHDLAPHRDGT